MRALVGFARFVGAVFLATLAGAWLGHGAVVLILSMEPPPPWDERPKHPQTAVHEGVDTDVNLWYDRTT